MSRSEQRRRARANVKHRAGGKKGRRPDQRERRAEERFEALDASGFVVAEGRLPADLRSPDA